MPTSDIDDVLRRAAAAAGPPLHGTVHLHCTDGEGEWLVAAAPAGSLAVRHEHAKGDVAARGPTADLRSLLAGRDAGGAVEVFGDATVLDRLVERTRSTS